MQQKQQLLRYTQKERNVLSGVNHPYIVRLHFAFQTSSQLAMVMYFCGGRSLMQLLKRVKVLQLPRASFDVAEILEALVYLHERHIASMV